MFPIQELSRLRTLLKTIILCMLEPRNIRQREWPYLPVLPNQRLLSSWTEALWRTGDTVISSIYNILNIIMHLQNFIIWLFRHPHIISELVSKAKSNLKLNFNGYFPKIDSYFVSLKEEIVGWQSFGRILQDGTHKR